MNTANPHQTIRPEGRRDKQATGKNVAHSVVRLDDHRAARMPGLNEGSNQGAQKVVEGYRQESIEQLVALRDMIGEVIRSPLNTATDEDLNRAALCCEVVAGAIYKYLQVMEAGSGQGEKPC